MTGPTWQTTSTFAMASGGTGTPPPSKLPRPNPGAPQGSSWLSHKRVLQRTLTSKPPKGVSKVMSPKWSMWTSPS